MTGDQAYYYDYDLDEAQAEAEWYEQQDDLVHEPVVATMSTVLVSEPLPSDSVSQASTELVGTAPSRGTLPRSKAGGIKSLVEPQPSLCLLYTSPSPRDGLLSRMPSSA